MVGPGNRVIDNDVNKVIGVGPANGFGIDVNGFACLAVNNRISDATVGLVMATVTTKYRDNLTAGVSFPYSGGTDAGNNN